MNLAHDLNELIAKYGPAMAASAEQALQPLHRPGHDPLPDLGPMEQSNPVIGSGVLVLPVTA
jgi:hypothetical protein